MIFFFSNDLHKTIIHSLANAKILGQVTDKFKFPFNLIFNALILEEKTKAIGFYCKKNKKQNLAIVKSFFSISVFYLTSQKAILFITTSQILFAVFFFLQICSKKKNKIKYTVVLKTKLWGCCSTIASGNM